MNRMRGNDPRSAPFAQHRKEPDGLVTIIDMHEIGLIFLEQIDEIPWMARSDELVDLARRRPLLDDVLVPEAQEKVPFGPVVLLGQRANRIEWKQLLIFQPLRIHRGAHALHAGDLPVDALHLRLQIRAAEADDVRTSVSGG